VATLRKGKNKGRGRKSGEPKPWYAKKGQAGSWKHCKFKRCKSIHKETKYRGYCSENCQKGRQISIKQGYQFDLGHSVRSSWERKYSWYLQHEKGYKLGVDYKYEPQKFYLGRYNKASLNYMPDFYLVKEDLWIEVKGYMSARNMEQIKRFRASGKRLEVVGAKFFKKRKRRTNT
jgi:hypothetical protein